MFFDLENCEKIEFIYSLLLVKKNEKEGNGLLVLQYSSNPSERNISMVSGRLAPKSISPQSVSPQSKVVKSISPQSEVD